MPITLNGIGTHYYGRSNPSSRSGICQLCHRQTVMATYDTRLWFVVVFIPIIPLGRKRIIDECSGCRRHFVADAGQYEMNRQLATSAALDRYQQESSVERALEAHAQMLSFRQFDQAAEFRQKALAEFPKQAALRSGLAQHLDEMSHHEEATQLFEQALQLQPGLPEARCGVALRRINEGKLAEARELLDVLMMTGAGQHFSLGPLESLGVAYQNKGQHAEALEVFGIILRELPQVGQVPGFRKLIQTSEKKLRGQETILPKRKHWLPGSSSQFATWRKRLVMGSIVIALIVGGMAASNEYIRRHRTVYVVNASPKAATLQIDDQPAVNVQGKTSVTLAEGIHHVHIEGPAKENYDIDLKSGYWERWGKSPLWLINVGGMGAFVNESIHYATQPMPPSYQIVLGQPFVSLPNIDFAFVDPPKKMEIPKGSKFVTKTHFKEINVPPAQIFRAAAQGQRAAALNFAEGHLRANTSDDELFNAYLNALSDAENPRGIAFLETGLDTRPVLVPWHRAYQEMLQNAGRGDEVVPRYDHLLSQSPNDARLLYLRGRLEVDRAREDDFLRRSIAADPSFPWPWYALGGEAATRANWEESLNCFNRAETLGMKTAELDAGKYTAELALGHAQTVIDKLRARVDADPLDLAAVAQLAEALVVAGQEKETTKLVADFESRVPPEQRHPSVEFLRGTVAYMCGDFSGCSESLRKVDHQQARLVWGHSLLCQGRVRDAAVAPELQTLWQDPENALALSLAFQLRGDQKQATVWRDKACDIWKSRGPRGQVQVDLLRQDTPPSPQQLEAISFLPQSQIILLAAMGRQFPSAKAYLDSQVGKLNVRRFPPFHLVQQALRADAR